MTEESLASQETIWIPWVEALLHSSIDGGEGALAYLEKWRAVARGKKDLPDSLKPLFMGDDSPARVAGQAKGLILPWTHQGDPTASRVIFLLTQPACAYSEALQICSAKYGSEVALVGA